MLRSKAQLLAEHGACLAANAGFEARALWVADERRIAATILDGADELDADLIVTGARVDTSEKEETAAAS
jgi:nucleotide-binding universal stress UspA family protein